MPTFTNVNVTQEDIDKGFRKKSGRCAVATALARIFPGAHHIDVDLQTVRFTVDDERRIYLTAQAAAGYIVAYDAGDPIHPFGFRLSERQRIQAQRPAPTPAYKKRARVRGNERYAKEQLAQAQEQRADLPADADPIEVVNADRQLAEAEKKVARRKRERKAVTEQTKGEPWVVPDKTVNPDNGLPKQRPPQRAFKTGRRAYGQRALRINQDDSPEGLAGRRAVMAGYEEWEGHDPEA